MRPLHERVLLTTEAAQYVLPTLTTAAIIVAPAPFVAHDRPTAQPGHVLALELPHPHQGGATGLHGEPNRGHARPIFEE